MQSVDVLERGRVSGWIHHQQKDAKVGGEHRRELRNVLKAQPTQALIRLNHHRLLALLCAQERQNGLCARLILVVYTYNSCQEGQ